MPFIKKSQPENTTPPTEDISQLRAEFWHQLWKTITLLFIAVVVIAAASVAWFVSNTRVNSATAPVSAGFEPIKLATKGVRQKAESDNLKLPEGNQLKDENGNVIEEYKEYYYTDGEPIALRLDADGHEVSPGAHGKVTFYVIPAKACGSLTLHIGLGGYGENEQKKVVAINNPVLNSLLSGHILLFDDYDAQTNTYSTCLFQGSDDGIYSNTITVDLTNAEADEPFPVDFYWIWPLRYENLEALLTEDEFGKLNADTLNPHEVLNQNYKYSRVFLTNQSELSQPDVRSKAYDLADEYIGGNAQYLYLTIQATTDNTQGGQQE